MTFVLNDGIRIRYETEGSANGSCLLLQHGFFGELQDWYDYGYVDNLKKYFKLILIDARGHGQSDKPHDPAEYSLRLRAQDVISVLDAEAVSKCHYLGYSMGGWISFGLMKWFPERFHSWILNAIHPYGNDMLPLRNQVKTLEHWIPDLNVSEEHKKRFLANDKEALAAAIAEARTDNSKLLKNLPVPCLMMDGENDPIYSKVCASAKSSPKIEFIGIPGADHWGSLYKSDFNIPRIKRFIDEIRNG